jgi:TonB family protein
MPSRLKQLSAIGLLAIVTAAGMPSAGHAADEGPRKVMKKVAPVYPETARKLQLSGTVRLVALVSADGEVKGTETVGGHPLLVAAATDAVMRWKFKVAERESREELVFTFAPE